MAGLAALGSGVLGVMGDLLALVVDLDSPLSATTAHYAIVFLVYLISAALLVVGLLGLYISQSQAEGTLGLAGFLLAFLGTVLLAGAFWFELFVTPALAAKSEYPSKRVARWLVEISSRVRNLPLAAVLTHKHPRG